MRLLICTQAVDRDDPTLGFFHRWIEEFASCADRVLVICLRKGNHALPQNVEVVALGGTWRLMRAVEVCALAFGRRKEYDAVFVHMNPEYLIAAGWLWRLLRKRTMLWYVHKAVNIRLRIAVYFAQTIFTASAASFRFPTRKVRIVGHGIDTDFFKPDPSVVRGGHFLSVGRLMKSKRHDFVIRAAKRADVPLRIVGGGSERARLEVLAKELDAEVVFVGVLTQKELVHEYQTARAFLHTSETGSLDKVVLEALACDCPVITTDVSLSDLPVVVSEAAPEAIARAAHDESRGVSPRGAEYVRMHHSLPRLIESIVM